jgi:hypothetical protein
LESTRASGFYPDIVMAGPAPLQTLRKLGAVEPQAKFFSRNRGRALVVRKGNPLGIRGLADVAVPARVWSCSITSPAFMRSHADQMAREHGMTQAQWIILALLAGTSVGPVAHRQLQCFVRLVLS